MLILIHWIYTVFKRGSSWFQRRAAHLANSECTPVPSLTLTNIGFDHQVHELLMDDLLMDDQDIQVVEILSGIYR